MSLWTAAEIAAATGGAASQDFEVEGVSIDSRSIAAGDLFIALKGPSFDGHVFIEKALKAGARGVLTEKTIAGPHVLVSDTTQALEDLGTAARQRFSGELIGITGSVGKTTTKEMCAAAFGAFTSVHATQGNLNNHLGVPLTLARMPRDTQTAIIEMGMNHFGEIAYLSDLAKPTTALITAIDWVHSENLDGTLAGVAEAKAEIAKGLSGALFAPLALKGLLGPKLPHTDVRWIEAPFAGTLSIPGEENKWNAALALAAVPPTQRRLAETALSRLKPHAGRGDEIDVKLAHANVTVLNDAYNAAPASMLAALKNLAARPTGRKIAVLGDMAELANPLILHENIGKFLAQTDINMVVAVGNFSQSILAPLPQSILSAHFSDPKQVAAYLLPLIQDGDQILVKASNSTGLSKVVADLEAAAIN